MKRFIRENIFQILDIFKAIGILLLLLMFMNFNIQLGNNVESAKKTADNTNKLVKSQNDILNAIKTATQDGNLTAEQKSDLTICLLQLPQPLRTPEMVRNCRAEVVDGTFPSSASAVSGNASKTANSESGNQSSSSPQSAPKSDTTPANNPQTPDNNGVILDLPLLPKVHIPSPF